MTPHQVAVNHRVITDEAAKLTEAGYPGDAHRFIEQLLLRAFSAGFRPLERVEVPPPSTSTPEARQAALRASQAAIDAVKRKRTQRVDT